MPRASESHLQPSRCNCSCPLTPVRHSACPTSERGKQSINNNFVYASLPGQVSFTTWTRIALLLLLRRSEAGTFSVNDALFMTLVIVIDGAVFLLHTTDVSGRIQHGYLGFIPPARQCVVPNAVPEPRTISE
jgi:hypothetical protein